MTAGLKVTALLLTLAVLISGCSEQASNGKNFHAPAANTGNKFADLPHSSARQMEILDRGLIAIPADEGVLVTWRKLYDDAGNLAFDVYRDGTKLTSEPITTTSNFLDK